MKTMIEFLTENNIEFRENENEILEIDLDTLKPGQFEMIQEFYEQSEQFKTKP